MTKNAYTHLDMTKGCVVLIDIWNSLDADPESGWKNSHPAYLQRADEMQINGVCSFVIIGPIVKVLHSDGTPYSDAEFADYIQKRKENTVIPTGGDEDAPEINHINVSHVIKIVEKGNGPLKVISKRETIRTDVPYFGQIVHNEAIRFFNGCIPPNLDIGYLESLLGRHRKGYLLTWRGQQHGPVFVYTGGVRNVKKFRKDFKRNVNRALYKNHDAKIVQELVNQQMYLEDTCDWEGDTMEERNQERRHKGDVFDVLKKTWPLLGSDRGWASRFDMTKRPHSLWEDGKRLPATVVLSRAFNEVSREIYEAEREEAKKNAQPVDDSNYSDYDSYGMDFGDAVSAPAEKYNPSAAAQSIANTLELLKKKLDQQDPLED